MRVPMILGFTTLLLILAIIGFALTSQPEMKPANRTELAAQVVMEPKPSIEIINQLRKALEPTPNIPSSQALTKLQAYLKIIETVPGTELKDQPQSITLDRVEAGKALVRECAIDDRMELATTLTTHNFYPMVAGFGLTIVLSLMLVKLSLNQDRLIRRVGDVLNGKTKNIEDALLSLRKTIKDYEETNSDLRQTILQLKRKQSIPPGPAPTNPHQPSRFSQTNPQGQGLSLHPHNSPNTPFKMKDESKKAHVPNIEQESESEPIQPTEKPATEQIPARKLTPILQVQSEPKPEPEPEPMNISDLETPSEQLTQFLQHQHTGGFTALKFTGPLFSETKDTFLKESNPNTETVTIIEISFQKLDRVKQIYGDDYEAIFKTICKETISCISQITDGSPTVNQTDQSLYWEIKGHITEEELPSIYEQFQEIYLGIVINWKVGDENIRINVPTIKFNIFGSAEHQAMAV